MLPKWFNDWNRENPTDIYGPAILVGALGGAVFVAILLVTWGQPFATTSMQTGPRGTGMSVPEFNVARIAPDPTIDAYYTDTPIVPEAGAPLAKDIYQNVQVLGDLTEDNFNRLMLAMTQWVSPDQGCTYCHGDVALEEYGKDDLYTKVVARRMAGVPGLTEDIQTIQKTEMTYSLMNYFANSLGVNCVFCHNSRAFYDPSQFTPQWSTAQMGRQMVIEVNTEYLMPLQDTYPPERLGPVYADAPKAACKTCHKGYQRPLQGMNVIADWPELAATGAPVYE